MYSPALTCDVTTIVTTIRKVAIDSSPLRLELLLIMATVFLYPETKAREKKKEKERQLCYNHVRSIDHTHDDHSRREFPTIMTHYDDARDFNRWYDDEPVRVLYPL